MGKFIITRSAAGDRFFLQSDSGHTLAVSRHYATLDACKKGIASLIVNAPVIPVLDATAGEYGPNPKFEIIAAEVGFAFLMKSANGKSVLHSPAYATKKACLRAIAMLRRGVTDYELLFHTKEGLTPLTMKAPKGAAAKPAADPAPAVIRRSKKPAAPSTFPDIEEQLDPDLLDPITEAVEVTKTVDASEIAASAKPAEPMGSTEVTEFAEATAPVEGAEEAPAVSAVPSTTQDAAPVTPRLIRLQPIDKVPSVPPSKPAKTQTSSAKAPAKRRGILGIIFKKEK